eukprot:COSAG02_NODE_1304_length_13353_cov_92.513883_4_plen_77_part_00
MLTPSWYWRRLALTVGIRSPLCPVSGSPHFLLRLAMRHNLVIMVVPTLALLCHRTHVHSHSLHGGAMDFRQDRLIR